jgi:hypothetical protein
VWVRDGPGDAARLARPVKAPDIPSSQFVFGKFLMWAPDIPKFTVCVI